MWVMRGMFWIEHGGEKQVQGYFFCEHSRKRLLKKAIQRAGGGM